jgi:hypothetical protein
MKDFLEKNKKTVITVSITLLVLIGGIVIYFFVLDGTLPFFKKEEDTEVEEKVEVYEEPKLITTASYQAIRFTFNAARDWADDVQLYNCSGLPTSIESPEITYEYVGARGGEYSRWMCTYYSKEKGQTKIYSYVEGRLDEDTEAIDIGEYGYLLYNDVNYPEDPRKIANSVDIYRIALEEGLNDTDNYVNMYLSDTQDYGFVWTLEERSKMELDENDIGVIVNTYVFDTNYKTELIDIVPEEVN